MTHIITFASHFGIKEPAESLEFIDIPLDTDIRYYIDPYRITRTPGDWFVTAHNLIVGFFEELLDAMQNDPIRVQYLTSYTYEPNETHFGLSEGEPKGTGLTGESARLFVDALRQSKAFRTKSLKNLGDAELMVPGIGPDRISDMVTNIIRGPLIEFTQEQCRKHRIPLRPVKSGPVWNNDTKTWEIQKRIMLPQFDGKPILLVPKQVGTGETLANTGNFYRFALIPFYQKLYEEEYATKGLHESLVKTLRSGEIRIYKKNVMERHPGNKEDIAKFVAGHPEVLKEYIETFKA